MNHYCDKCNKEMDESNFYTYKDGRKTELCKKCLTMHIDNFDESTYLWLLEKMDVPYVPEEWNVLRDRAYAKDPHKMNGMSVFGKYLSKMKLKQWKQYSWADTEKLQSEGRARAEARKTEIEESNALLKEQFEKGEINEAQYKTLMSTEAQYESEPMFGQQPIIGDNNFYDENNFLDDVELADPAAELTAEDKIYLAMKWGRLYKPSEWIELERMFNEMTASFDIQDADSKNTLVLLCKTNLKANQAIDCGDIEGFQKLSKVSESLRKTAKFTAAQNKEAKENFVDSVGELIALCERDGFIPRYATDIPQDKVDATLKDMNNYVQKLVTQDLGFGQQIEDALKKIQIQKEMNEAAEARQAEEEKNGDFDIFGAIELDDNDLTNFFNDLQDQKEADAKIFDQDGDD